PHHSLHGSPGPWRPWRIRCALLLLLLLLRLARPGLVRPLGGVHALHQLAVDFHVRAVVVDELAAEVAGVPHGAGGEELEDEPERADRARGAALEARGAEQRD